MAKMKELASIVSVLPAIQKVYPEAFIAGGCMRDLLLDHPINDIDVFIPGPPRVEDEQYSLRPKDNSMCETASDKPDYDGSRLYDVLNGCTWLSNQGYLDPYSYPIQLLFSTEEDKASIISNFALGIQQAWWYEEAECILTTAAFDNDRDCKTFTITRCDSNEDAYAINRKIISLGKRYKGYKLVIHSEYKEWEQILKGSYEPSLG